MLNSESGTESDLTITRLGEEEFMAITSPTSHNKDFYWIKTSHFYKIHNRNHIF